MMTAATVVIIMMATAGVVEAGAVVPLPEVVVVAVVAGVDHRMEAGVTNPEAVVEEVVADGVTTGRVQFLHRCMMRGDHVVQSLKLKLSILCHWFLSQYVKSKSLTSVFLLVDQSSPGMSLDTNRFSVCA